MSGETVRSRLGNDPLCISSVTAALSAMTGKLKPLRYLASSNVESLVKDEAMNPITIKNRA